jgi:hypothetical protein
VTSYGWQFDASVLKEKGTGKYQVISPPGLPFYCGKLSQWEITSVMKYKLLNQYILKV